MENEKHVELVITEAEVQKLNLQPGEVLVVKLYGDEITEYDLDGLKKGFQSLIPNNKVAVLALGSENKMELTTLKGTDYPSYCGDCGCGKKEVAEAMIAEDLKKKEDR